MAGACCSSRSRTLFSGVHKVTSRHSKTVKALKFKMTPVCGLDVSHNPLCFRVQLNDPCGFSYPIEP